MQLSMDFQEPAYSCSDNNTSTTVLRHFISAAQEFGFPSRLRIDIGGENVKVAKLMFYARGVGRGSVLAGRSVHNQRIERFWSDLLHNGIA